MRLLARISGEHPTLPEAELRAVLEADGHVWTDVARRGRLLIGDVRGRTGADPSPRAIAHSVSRLAMTYDVARYRATTERTERGLLAAAEELGPGLLADVATFAVRAERADPDAAQPELLGRLDVERILGGALAGHARVDLSRPERVVRTWIDGDKAIIGDLLWVNDRGTFETRATKHRPYFSPVSGHPRWMRAIANLVAPSPPGVVYDPLCGTGGTLLEAGLAGHRTVGSDIDPRMVEGTTANLAHAKVDPLAVFPANVREAAALFRNETGLSGPDAIVTDLPYGQSASTGKEGAEQVARWTLDTVADLLPAGRLAAIGAASESWLEPLPPGLVRVASYSLRVHKSLTRTYVVLRAAA